LLHPNPDGRYQSAAALHADLNRFLDRLPLREVANPWSERTRNWIRRNPSLTSTATVATVAAVLLASAGATGYLLRERSRTLEARVAFTDHLHSQSELQALIDDRNQTPESLSQQVQLGHQLLSRYRVPSDHRSEAWQEHPLVRYLPEPERQALRKQIGEVFYLLAKSAALRAKLTQDAGEQARELQQAQQWNEHAAHYAQESIPRAILEQRADLLLAAGDAERAEQVRREVRELDPASSRDRYLLGYWQHHQGRLRAAVRELQLATDEDPTQFSTWFVLGNTYLALGQAEAAARCFTAAIALRPHFAPARLNRGMAFTRLRLYREAEADLTEAAKSEKTRVEALIQRGGVAQAQGRIDDAIADYSEALTYDRCPSRVYFYRAASKDACGDKRGAAEDRERGMKEAPQDELSWVARAEQRLAQDATAALADVQSALKLNPTSFSGLQLLAHIQAEHLHQIPQAIQTLDRAIQWYPESAVLLAGRGVLLARSGSRELAHRDGGQALRFDSSGQNLFQVGCIYAQTARTHPEDRFRACELLTAALKAGFGHALLSRDSDLEPIRKSPEFQVLIQNNSRMKSR
jgi:tetratricopeptide (TPR) repeat protein